MNEEYHDSEVRWQELFDSPSGDPDEKFLRQLEERSTQEYRRACAASTPVADYKWHWVGAALAASVGCLWFVASRPGDAPKQPSSKVVVAERPAEMSQSSCWSLRVAFAESDDSLSEVLDSHLQSRSSSADVVAWANTSLLSELDLE